jgi:hypothetical protein
MLLKVYKILVKEVNTILKQFKITTKFAPIT